MSKAVFTGRLVASVVRVAGQPKIADPELADREWEANTRQRVNTEDSAPNDATASAPAPRQRVVTELPAAVPAYHVSQAVRAAAAARREAAQADMAELELAKQRGRLIDAEEAEADVIAAYSLVKTRLLGVPTLAAQRLPHLATEIEPVIDELIRAALEELSAGDGGDRDV